MAEIEYEKFGSLQMTKLENEDYRIYHYPDGSSFEVGEVTHLHVKRSEKGDAHRLRRNDGVFFYVPPGWIAIEFGMEGWTL